MPRSFMFYIILCAGIIIDQGIKILVRNTMTLGESFSVIGDIFKITYIENRGVAFSIGEGNPILLYLMPAVFIVLGYLFWCKYKDKYHKMMTVGGSIVIAGGLSNLLDRVIFSSVTDYFDLKDFAIFNMADVFVDVGMAVVLFAIFFVKEKNIK